MERNGAGAAAPTPPLSSPSQDPGEMPSYFPEQGVIAFPFVLCETRHHDQVIEQVSLRSPGQISPLAAAAENGDSDHGDPAPGFGSVTLGRPVRPAGA